MPNHIIGYTFPTGKYDLNYPFIDVLRYGSVHVDQFNLFGTHWDESADYFDQISEFSSSKIILGFPVGCKMPHFGNFTINEAKKVARFAKQRNFQGISLWSLNKDTNRRVGRICNEFQTGFPDGFYTEALISELV